MLALVAAWQSAHTSNRRLRAKKPGLGVEQLDKRQVLSAAPTVDVPDSFVVEEQQTAGLDFGSMPFADVDSPGSKRMTVTVKSQGGTLSASSGSGVRVTGKGATRVFRGSLDNLNNYFSGAGQITYRNNSQGAYSLSVRIAEKVSRRTLSSTDWATIHVTSTPAFSWSNSSPSSSWSSGFDDDFQVHSLPLSWTSYASTSSDSSYSPSYSSYSSYSPASSWSSDYSYYPSTTSSWYSSPSTSSYSSYSYPSTSYSSYYYPSTSYSSYYPSSSWYSSSYPSYSSSYSYGSYYPSSSTSGYYSTALNTAASNTQSLLNLQSSYNQLQSLNSQLAAMGQSTYATGSALQFGSTNWGSPIQVGTVNWGDTIQLGTANWGSAGYGLNFGPLFW
jgi:hypothetical protein